MNFHRKIDILIPGINRDIEMIHQMKNILINVGRIDRGLNLGIGKDIVIRYSLLSYDTCMQASRLARKQHHHTIG